MSTIKPLTSLTRAEVRELAIAAADRGEPLNPYPAMTERNVWFQTEYSNRQRELSPA